MKHSVESYLIFLTNAINVASSESELPEKFKKSDVIPFYKKNYRPASVLPYSLEGYKLTNYLKHNLSKYITGFHKSHVTQHSLTTVLEKRKKQC